MQFIIHDFTLTLLHGIFRRRNITFTPLVVRSNELHVSACQNHRQAHLIISALSWSFTKIRQILRSKRSRWLAPSQYARRIEVKIKSQLHWATLYVYRALIVLALISFMKCWDSPNVSGSSTNRL
jgi:hypothetical protein